MDKLKKAIAEFTSKCESLPKETRNQSGLICIAFGIGEDGVPTVMAAAAGNTTAISKRVKVAMGKQKGIEQTILEAAHRFLMPEKGIIERILEHIMEDGDGECDGNCEGCKNNSAKEKEDKKDAE